MISIKEAKQLREKLGLTHLVILGVSDDGKQHVATHGKSIVQAKEAANMGNNLKKEIGWPSSLCHSQPLERKCENCSYWQRKRLDHSERIPENWPGRCMFNPEPIIRYAEDRACVNFEPNVSH